MSAFWAAIASGLRQNWQVALALALTAAVAADTLWLAPVSQGAAQAVLVALVAASAVAGYGGVPGRRWLRQHRQRRRREQLRALERETRQRAHAAWVEAVRRRAAQQAAEYPPCYLPGAAWDYLNRERGHRP